MINPWPSKSPHAPTRHRSPRQAPQPVPVAPLPPRPVRPDVRPAAPPVPAKAVTEAAEVEAEDPGPGQKFRK